MKNDNLTSSFLALREKLHRSALRFLNNEEDAADALQETFFRLWKNGAVETETEARNKLFAVLRNICIDRLRRPQTQPFGESCSEQLEVRPESGEDMVRYESLLTTGLSDIQRQIYTLVTHHGIEYEVIASQLGMTVEAVRMNMSRARKKIRENYNKLDK